MGWSGKRTMPGYVNGSLWPWIKGPIYGYKNCCFSDNKGRTESDIP